MEYEVGKVYQWPDRPGRWRYNGGDPESARSWTEVKDVEPEAPGFIESVGRGVQDVIEGVEQLRLNITNPDAARVFTEDINRERAEFEDRGGSKAFGRGIGTALSTLPLALMPFGASASLLTRLAAAGAAGGVAGGLQFSPENSARQRAINTGVGTVIGAAAPEAARAVGPYVAGGLRRATGRVRPSAEALQRQANFAELGIRPTSAQVTRNPAQYAQEFNYAQVAGLGDELGAVRAAQPGRLAEVLDETVPGSPQTVTATGRQVQDALGSRMDRSGIYGSMGRTADELFDQARAAAGVDDVLDFAEFGVRVGDTLSDFEDAIPAAVTRRLGSFTRQDAPRRFTVGEAFKLRQLLNTRARASNNPAEAQAMNRLKGVLDEFLEESGQAGAGGDALDLFRQANAASRRRTQAFSTDPMNRSVAGTLAPDDFVNRAILSGKVDDIRQLRATLLRQGGQGGKEAWDAVRRQVVDYLHDKALNDAGEFSASRYNNALGRLGNDRLEVLFSGDELAQLRRIGQAAVDLFTAPASGGIPVGNRSGTAAGLIGMSSQLGGGLMGPLGRVAAPLARNIQGRAVVNQALSGSPVPPQSPINQYIINRLIHPYGTNPLAAMVGGLMAPR